MKRAIIHLKELRQDYIYLAKRGLKDELLKKRILLAREVVDRLWYLK